MFSQYNRLIIEYTGPSENIRRLKIVTNNQLLKIILRYKCYILKQKHALIIFVLEFGASYGRNVMV